MATSTDGDRRAPRHARALVLVLAVALVVPGLLSVEAWPMTAWRLFSSSRDETQDRWEIVAVDGEGEAEPVDLDELPIAFRNAEWPLSDLDGASPARRQEVCGALLDGVVGALPGTEALRIVENHRTLVQRDGEWIVLDDRALFLSCERSEQRRPAARAPARPMAMGVGRSSTEALSCARGAA